MILGIDTQVLIFAEWVPGKQNEESRERDELRTRAQLLLYKAIDKLPNMVSGQPDVLKVADVAE